MYSCKEYFIEINCFSTDTVISTATIAAAVGACLTLDVCVSANEPHALLQLINDTRVPVWRVLMT